MVLVTRDVLKALSDEKSVELFRIVATTNPYSNTGDILRSKTKLTYKQYNSRMSKLMKVGLTKRKNGTHSLTALGKVIYNTQMKIENAVNYYWKLKAIDLFEPSDHDFMEEELKKLIDNLIDNHEIKDMLIRANDKDNNGIESDERLLNIRQNQPKTNESRKQEGKI